MTSLEGFVYLLTSMFLFTVLTTGVVAGYRLAVGCLRSCFCGPNGDLSARLVAGAGIIVSLMILPCARIMEVPLLNVLPLVIYMVYMALGMFHLFKWRCEILALLRGIAGRCKPCSEPKDDCGEKKDPCPEPCGCGGSPGCGCGKKKPDCGCPDKKPGDTGSACDSAFPPRFDGKP